MRNVMLLGARLVLGGYMVVHGAQKLFGSFGGHGLEKTAAGFESMGLTPGKEMATLAGATELGGGLLTAAGIADPLGPLAIIGAMTIASATHRENGPLAANRGFELPLTNLAAAAALAAAGPGRIRLGKPLPRLLAFAAVLGGGAIAGVTLAKLLNQPADDAGDAGTPTSPGEPASAGEPASSAAAGEAAGPAQPGAPANVGGARPADSGPSSG